jgi:membrane AbrB-like protein
MPLARPFIPMPQWLGTLLLAFLGAQACLWANTPIPWMLGPLIVTATASMAGAPTYSWPLMRKFGQATIGMSLGLYFSPDMVALIGRLWWAIGLAIVWSLAMGYLCGVWLFRLNKERNPDLQRSTTYFSGAIGGASEMTQLAERMGGRSDWVASAHSLRVLLVTITIPFAMQWGQFNGHAMWQSSPVAFDPLGLAALIVLSGLSVALLRRFHSANPWFLGSLAVGILVTALGQSWTSIPSAMSQAAQMFIGISLGVQFTPRFLRTAPHWLASVGLSTLSMMGLSVLFSWLLAQAIDLPTATLVLGTAPGGMAEMTITAKVLQLGVPIVTAFQVSRLVAILILVGPIYRWWVAPNNGRDKTTG